MNLIRVGILGAGARGRDFLRLFSRPGDNIEVVAVADTNKEILSDLAKSTVLCPRLYTDPREMFSSMDVDVVVITTPDWLHEEHACAALNAAKDVYLEKPMAITPEGCERVMKAARLSHRVLYVGHNLRHFTVIKKLKELIDEGAIGEVKAVWCRHPVSYGRTYFKESRWHRKRKSVGSLLIHKGSHDLDVIHWLGGGHATRVVAMGKLAVWHNQSTESDVEDLSSVLMQLSNGVQATYEQCHFAFRSSREYMIHGTKGTLQNDGDRATDAVIKLFGKRGKDLLGEITGEWRFEEEEGFHGDADSRIVDEFINVLRGTAKPTMLIEDAVWAVKTGYAATQSLRNGNVPIDIS